MRQAVRALPKNMFALVEVILVDYANQLRAAYPKRQIRNATVFASAVPECARLGYIELVDARQKIPAHISDYVAHKIKRARQPIWVPGKKFPRNPFDMFELMNPSMHGDEIVWRHTPKKRRT